MAKRLTDVNKWDDPWFVDLKHEYRFLWLYILDKCNHAGIWKVNKRMAEFVIGAEVDFEGFLKASKNRVKVYQDGEKWFIRKFLDFQYGQLLETNRVHVSVLSELKKEGLYKDYISPFQGDKDKDINKDKEKEKDKDSFNSLKAFEEIWKQYPNKAGKTKAQEKFCKSVKTEEDLEAIRKALGAYLKHLQVNTWKQAQDGKTWFNSWRDWVDFKDEKPGVPKREKKFKPDCGCDQGFRIQNGLKIPCWCWS